MTDYSDDYVAQDGYAESNEGAIIAVARGLFVDDGDGRGLHFEITNAGRFIEFTTPAFNGVLHEDECYDLLKQLTAVLL